MSQRGVEVVGGEGRTLDCASAWVDESIRLGRPPDGSGTYLLAGAVAAGKDLDLIRASLRNLRVGKAPRLHWQSENPTRRAVLSAAISELPVTSYVIIGAPVESGKEERARRICLERLCYELGEIGVRNVVIERRDAALNRRDLTMLDAMRRSRSIAADIRFDFGDPYIEPMLWIPDIVAGAIGTGFRVGGVVNQINVTIR